MSNIETAVIFLCYIVATLDLQYNWNSPIACVFCYIANIARFCITFFIATVIS